MKLSRDLIRQCCPNVDIDSRFPFSGYKIKTRTGSSAILTQAEFKVADPDNDGTLSKDEYLAVVEKRFKAADPDNDGTVSAAEFKTAAGRSLSQLLS